VHDHPDRETEQLANAFRPNRAPALFAIVANVVLAAAFLGVPYLRGRSASTQARNAFADLAACLLDAKVAARGGLALPLGDEERYAGLVMRGGADWPARCLPALRRVAPEEATFLWPSFKQAAADLRAAVELTEGELEALIASRKAGHGRVPVRPMLALSKLRAALTLLAQASGDTEGLDADAVRFDGPGLATAVTRLPISAGGDALLQLWPTAEGIEATALDARGLSWLRLDAGKLDRFRFASGALVRATLRSEEQSYVVWGMSAERCAEKEDHCTKRASGVAALPMGTETLPDPIWLGGHPAGRPDRVLAVHERSVTLLASHGTDGELELRRFTLPAAPSDARPLAPERRAASAPRAADAVLIDARAGDYAYLAAGTSPLQGVLSRDFGATEEPLGELAGDSGWIAACSAQDTHWIVFGSATQVRVSQASAGQAVTGAPITLGVGDPFHATRPAQDRLKLRCDRANLHVLLLDDTGRLYLTRCGGQAICQAPRELAHAVQRFDALALADALLIASSGGGADADVRTQRVTPAGPERATPVAPCWDPTGGFCGQPTLVGDQERVLLVAREGSDLLLVESRDAGKSWQAAAGLQVYDAADTGNAAPMDQHRLRKGLR
jgi:hypothetical protein